MDFAKIMIRLFAVIFLVASLVSVYILPFDSAFRKTIPFIFVYVIFTILVLWLAWSMWCFEWRAHLGVQLMTFFGVFLFFALLFMLKGKVELEPWRRNIWLGTILLYVFINYLLKKCEKVFLGY